MEIERPRANQATRPRGLVWPSRRRYRELTTDELLLVLGDAGHGS